MDKYLDEQPVQEIVDDSKIIPVHDEGTVVIDLTSPSRVENREVEHVTASMTPLYDEFAKFISSDAEEMRIVKNADNTITIMQIGKAMKNIELDDNDFSDMSIPPSQEDNTTARIIDIMEAARSEMDDTYTRRVGDNLVRFDSTGNVVDVAPVEEKENEQSSSKTM